VVPEQALWERDLPGEQGGKEGLEAALEHHSTAKQTVGHMLPYVTWSYVSCASSDCVLF